MALRLGGVLPVPVTLSARGRQTNVEAALYKTERRFRHDILPTSQFRLRLFMSLGDKYRVAVLPHGTTSSRQSCCPGWHKRFRDMGILLRKEYRSMSQTYPLRSSRQSLYRIGLSTMSSLQVQNAPGPREARRPSPAIRSSGAD